MKKITYSVAFVATLLATSNTFAQQGFGTNTPHRSAAVEIKSSNKGLLIPRVTLDALTGEDAKLNSSVDNANSLLVYHLGSTGIPAGYYYWNGTSWIAFVTSATQTSTVVTATGDDPLTSTPTTVDGVSTYDVKLTAGTNNQFLVSRLKADSTTEFESVWVTIGGDISAEAGYNAISVDKIKGVAVAYENQGTLTTAPSTGEFLFFDGTNWTNRNFKELVQANQVKYTVNHNTTTQEILWVTPNNTDLDNITYTVNIDPSSLVADGIKTANAIDTITLTSEQATDAGLATGAGNYVVLGGDLIKETEITLNGNEFVINSDNDKFKVTGLTSLPLLGVSEENGYKNYEATTGHGFEVMINNSTDNSVRKATAGQIAAAGLEVKNGLNINISGTGSKAVVELGGDLLRATEIGTSATNTLAIDGLVNVDGTTDAELGVNFASVVVDKDGVLRTLETTTSFNLLNSVTSLDALNGSLLSSTAKNYEEITINANGGGIITLPTAVNAKGQIINVIINSDLGDSTLFLTGAGGNLETLDTDNDGVNDLVEAGYSTTATNILAYGEMLGQRFTLKSDGTNWIVTSRM